jgi:hypothetical protein
VEAAQVLVAMGDEVDPQGVCDVASGLVLARLFSTSFRERPNHLDGMEMEGTVQKSYVACYFLMECFGIEFAEFVEAFIKM